MKKYILIFFLINFLFFAGIAFSQLPEKPDPPRMVNDLASLLETEEEHALEEMLVAFNDSTSTQIVIVTINSLQENPIDDYSFKLAEKWGIGQKGKNNGLLILVARESRDVFIATGYGLEEYVPDAIAKRIVETIIIPEFKQGNFYNGLRLGSEKIMGLTTGNFSAEEISGEGKREIPGYIVLIIIMLVLLFIIRSKNSHYRETIGGRRPIGGWRGFSSGSGVFGGGSGGGGFGGFGGGSFGGGGAGGKW